MPTDIVMPQMGESIVEGTITKWLKKPGDKVQRDEPLFEISTDKVDAEIPAPASGVLQDIKVSEGSTVQVNTIVGTIAADGETAAPAKSATPQAAADKKKEPPPASSQPEPVAEAKEPAAEEGDEHARSSPLVRKIARDNNINLAKVAGTGLGGRITKQDIQAFIDGNQSAPSPVSAPPPARPAGSGTASPPAAAGKRRTSPRSPRPASCSPSSTTGCATGTSGP